MNHLDLNLIRVFVAIYETRSVTQAAERLDVTQPTISYGLAKMRQVYADRLFSRSGAGLVPTGLAEQLFERFREALATIESTLEQQSPFDAALSTRRFRLAMSDIGVLYFVPPLVRRFQEVAPRIVIDVSQISDNVGEDLAAGRLDLAVGHIPALGPPTRTALLFREHYVCLMSANHPSIGAAMSLKEFAAARHVMVSSPRSGHFQRVQLKSASKEWLHLGQAICTCVPSGARNRCEHVGQGKTSSSPAGAPSLNCSLASRLSSIKGP